MDPNNTANIQNLWAYTNLLRKALNIPSTAHMTNRELYGNLPRADNIVRHRRLHFAGHAARCIADRYQPVADLVFWQGSGPCEIGKQKDMPQDSLKDLGGQTSAAEALRCAANRDEWRNRIN